MRKQTISKIAALALATMSVVPMFSLNASATVTKTLGTEATGGHNVITGSAYLLRWSSKVTTYALTAAKNPTTELYELTTVTTDTTIYYDADVDGNGDGTTGTPTYCQIPVTYNGYVYYCDNNYKPKAYTDLVAALADAKTAREKDLADTKKAYDNYNSDISNRKKAEVSADKAISFKDGARVPGTATFTDSKGYTVIVVADDIGSYHHYYYNGYDKEHYTGTTWNNPDDPGAGTKNYNIAEIISATTTEKGMPQLANEVGTFVQIDNDGIIKKGTTATGAGNYRIQVTSNNGTSDGTTTTVIGPGSGSSNGTVSGVGGSNNSSTTTPSTKFDYSLSYTPYYNLYSPRLNLYFPTAADAIAAGATDYRQVSGSQTTTPTYDSSASVSTSYPWYSTVTGRYYKTSADAVAASGGSSSAVYNYYDRYYYNLYGLYGYGYGYGYTYPTTTTTTTTDTSNVTIGKYKGWTYVNRYIRSASSGASYTVSMNGETSIPSNVLSTLYGKDVTVNFKFNSGAILSINGKNLSSTSSISTDIKYNTKNVPDSLVKKAVKADDGVSSAQFTVSGGNMSASASVTIKFKASRAGCTAKLYRYNSSSNSLSLVSTTVIKSNGNGVFDKVSQGGSYLVVLS